MDETRGRETAGEIRSGRAPSRFAVYFRVRHYEADALGHVNNAAWLHYLEHAAIEHSAALGYSLERFAALGGAFIVRRHEIDYLAPAAPGDTLQVLTWPVEFEGARAIREYEVRLAASAAEASGTPVPADRFWPAAETPDGPLLVRARTVWVWVDATRGRPRRIPPELHDVFFPVG